jgi:glycerophosphoryl diester phosphodiesterase
MPEIHGHRGARALRPENTLPGLACALAVGVDAIEFDVTLTADGGLILAHDLIVSSQTILDTAPVCAGDPDFPYVGKPWTALTLPQVATLDAGSRRPVTPFEATFVAVPAAGVPTLDQVCRLVTSLGAHSVTLATELKTSPRWPAADVRRLTEAALETLAAHGLTSQARILAFDWRVLRAAQALDPAVPRVALVDPSTWVPGSAWLAGLDPARYAPHPGGPHPGAPEPGAPEPGAPEPGAPEPGAPEPGTPEPGGPQPGTPEPGSSEPDGAVGCAAAARDIEAAWLSPADSMTSADLVAAAQREGLRTAVWTVNDPTRMADLVELKVDAIVTDRPDLLRQVLADHGDKLPPPVPRS